MPKPTISREKNHICVSGTIGMPGASGVVCRKLELIWSRGSKVIASTIGDHYKLHLNFGCNTKQLFHLLWRVFSVSF